MTVEDGGRRQQAAGGRTQPKTGQRQGRGKQSSPSGRGVDAGGLGGDFRRVVWVATEGRVSAAGDRRRREEAEKEEAGEGKGGVTRVWEAEEEGGKRVWV